MAWKTGALLIVNGFLGDETCHLYCIVVEGNVGFQSWRQEAELV